MFDIRTAPIEELLKDKAECEDDIVLCQTARLGGITSYSGGSVVSRISTNKYIIAVIDAELERRNRDGLAENE